MHARACALFAVRAGLVDHLAEDGQRRLLDALVNMVSVGEGASKGGPPGDPGRGGETVTLECEAVVVAALRLATHLLGALGEVPAEVRKRTIGRCVEYAPRGLVPLVHLWNIPLRGQHAGHESRLRAETH